MEETLIVQHKETVSSSMALGFYAILSICLVYNPAVPDFFNGFLSPFNFGFPL